MARFRKRPVEVEAEQYLGDPLRAPAGVCVSMRIGHPAEPHIHTEEGILIVSPGDWVIRGVRGEYYPCKPDIFAETYEPVDSVAFDAWARAYDPRWRGGN